jgi:hypothetical protein
MAKGRNYSKKSKANTTAIKDSARSSNVSRESKQGKNKEIKEVIHKEPFILKFQNLEQDGSYEEWIKLIHNHAIEKYGEMAQEIMRNEPLEDPEEIARPNAHANSIVVQEYNVQYKYRLDELNQRKKDRIKIIGFVRTHISSDLVDELNQTVPNALTDANIPNYIKALYKAYKQSSIHNDKQSQKDFMYRYTVFLQPFHWGKDYNIITHHRHYQELVKEFAIVGLQTPSEATQASDFIYSLSPDFSKMQADLRNNEIWVKTLSEEDDYDRRFKEKSDLMPKTLSAALTYARQYVMSAKEVQDNVHVSNSNNSNRNQNFSRGGRNGGRGRGGRDNHGRGRGRGRGNGAAANAEDEQPPKDQKENANASKSGDKHCVICDKSGSHTTEECYRLPKMIKNYKEVLNNKYNKKKNVQFSNIQTEYGDDENEVNYSYTSNMNAYCNPSPMRSGSYLVQLDNGANVHTFKSKKLINNIKRIHKNNMVNTSNGVITHSYVGDTLFGPVFYNPNIQFNILSQSLVERIYRHEAIKNEEGLTIRHDVYIPQYNITLHFRLSNGIYLCDLKFMLDFPPLDPPELKGTLTDNSNLIKPSEIVRKDPVDVQIDTAVNDAAELYSAPVSTIYNTSKKQLDVAMVTKNVVQPNLGYMSDSDLIHQLQRGYIINAPIQSIDVKRSTELLGPMIPALQGKTTLQKQHFNSQLLQTLQENEVYLEYDLMIVTGGLVFLLGVCYPGFYSTLHYLGHGKGAKTPQVIREPLLSSFATFKSYKRTIKAVATDGEGAFHVLKNDIRENGGEFITKPKNGHLPYADVKIKIIKELIAATKFPMPRIILKAIAFYANEMKNYSSNSGNINSISPYNFITNGRPLDYSVVCKGKVLDYVEASDENMIQRNSVLKRRTISGILSHPVDADGTWAIINVDTFKEFNRKHFRVLPCPDSVINIFQQLFQKDKLNSSKSEDIAEFGVYFNNSAIKSVADSAIETEVEVEVSQLSNPNVIVRYNLLQSMLLYGFDKSIVSMMKELRGIVKRNVFRGVHLHELNEQEQKEIITGRMNLIQKQVFHNNVQQPETIIKSRYVGHGFKQDRDKYNHNLDIYAPTAALSSAFLFFTLAAVKKQQICVTDVTQAFLRAKTKKTTHLLVDPIVSLILCDLYPEFKEFVLNDGKLLVKLDYALYGIIEAANLWYNDLQKTHVQLGFQVNRYDPCIVTKPEIQKLCYVDDIANRADSKAILDTHIRHLEKVYGKMTVQYGPTVHFLGANFHLPGDGTVHISIKLYLSKLCEENMDLINGKSNKYPAKINLFDIDYNSTLLDKKDSERVHSIIAKILYASQKRPDFNPAIAFLSTRVTSLTIEDREKVIYLLRYIYGTLDLELILGGYNNNGDIQFTAYADASYGTHDDGKSHSGWIFTLGRGAVVSNSTKQKLVVKSSAEGEFVTLSDMISSAAHEKDKLSAMNNDIVSSGLIMEDNEAAIHLAERGKSNSSRTKHIKIRYFFIKQYLDNGEFILIHCPTNQMIADILTKPLQGALFFTLRDLLLGYTTADSIMLAMKKN